MSTVRTLLPTDLPALIAHPGLSRDNAAFARERLGIGDAQPNLSAVADQLRSFARQRRAWVSMRRQKLQGLVGARQRGGKAAWEIDYLLDATRDTDVAGALVEHAVAQVGLQGAQKLFLRLPAGSDLLQPVLNSGFVSYKEETLFVRRPSSPPAANPPAGLRDAHASDSYPLFRLYCAAVPETVRRYEAATFDEWHAAQEKRWHKNGISLILERNGALQAQIRACRLPQGLMLDLVLDALTEDVPSLVAAAITAAEAQAEPVLTLVPREAGTIVQTLESTGFSAQEHYVSLVKRTTKPITLPRKVPVVAKNAVGV